MELEDLAIFRTVVHEGGILKAARKLHRVPSNVTTRVKQLEASLGAELFFRDKQRLHLSPSGHQLLDYAEQLLRLSNEARQAVAGGAPSGVLRIGALESTTASRLPAVLAAYHQRYPDVRVELTTGTNDSLVAALMARKVDAAFVAEAPADKGIAAMPLFRERLLIISPEGHAPITRPQDPERLRVPARADALARRQAPRVDPRARPELVPRDRGVCRGRHRGRADSRSGARHVPRPAGAAAPAAGRARRDHDAAGVARRRGAVCARRAAR
jgi:DNA-binding transcriptional LysR family regulator